MHKPVLEDEWGCLMVVNKKGSRRKELSEQKEQLGRSNSVQNQVGRAMEEIEFGNSAIFQEHVFLWQRQSQAAMQMPSAESY